MYVKELYVMAVINNKHITSHYIHNVKSYEDIYNYLKKNYNCKVIVHHKRDTDLFDEDLEKIINWEYVSLFLYVYLE